MQAPAKALGLQLHSMEVSRSEKLDNAFKAAVKASSGALTVNLSPMLNGNQRRVHELAARDRLPAIYTRAEFVQSGGLMSYGADRDAICFARAAAIVDKILKGTKPSDLPVERPTKFKFVINLKGCKADRINDPAECVGQSGQSDSIKLSVTRGQLSVETSGTNK